MDCFDENLVTAATFYFTRRNTWANFNKNKNGLHLYSTSNKWNIAEKKFFLICPRPICILAFSKPSRFVYGSPFTFQQFQ